MTASKVQMGTAPTEHGEKDSTSRGTAEFVLRRDGSILLILHATTDHERKQLADLGGKRVTMKTVQHYGDEIWLSFSDEAQ